MKHPDNLTRRSTLKGMGAAGVSSILATAGVANEKMDLGSDPEKTPQPASDQTLKEKVDSTPFVDTHEHLIEERHRLTGTTHPQVPCDDWAVLLNHYLNSDLLVAGMPHDAYQKLFSKDVPPLQKWTILKPYWPAVKNTGYGQAVRLTIRGLYGVEEVSDRTVKQIQSGYDKTRRPGFYRHILRDLANIESCQVNCLDGPFGKTDMPGFLMQDLSIVGMFAGPDIKGLATPTGIQPTCLTDWHRVIDWWFAKHGHAAVAVKSQNAYSRDIDYERVPAEDVETTFKKRLKRDRLTSQERKALEDHLFWYAVDKATEYNLPVKLHTGYYAGQDNMPLERLLHNPGSASDLCRRSRKTRFVFMHICYPYYEELLAVAKHYSNAYIDMCWSWIINPVAATDFLKKALVTAPANKILTFGGDYILVEPVLGHAQMARHGITLALKELIEDGWLSQADALALVGPLMRENAYRIFDLDGGTV
ncbi:MAG: amidohydrolase family protein [Planctomycetes bacterium]|nr:amidohydrolase family protein [Planctomycetota bacterium]